MPVDTKHAEYDKYAPKWRKCRDVVGGEDTMHGAAEMYLRKFKDEPVEDYRARVDRSTFYNASSRTISGLVGMLFRKPPKIKVSAAVEAYLDDITTSGVPFTVFAEDYAEETMTVGRGGILVDFPIVKEDGEILTVAKAEAKNLRPTMQEYDTEQIINWRYGRVNNETAPVLVVLAEMATIQKNEFEVKTKPQWRVLDLNPAAGNTYRVRVFQKDDKGNDIIVDEYVPLMNGKPLSYIPFYMDTRVCLPPLYDLITLNIKHYQVSSDYEHACHFTALPTPFVTGYKAPMPEVGKRAEKKSLRIGSTTILTFEDKDAKLGFLEYSGEGIGAVERNLDRKEQQMAVLGARMLAAEKKQAETATTSAIHRTGENSILGNQAIQVSLILKAALTTFNEWGGGNPAEVEFEINREFLPYSMDAPTLIALTKAVQGGLMSPESFFEILQRADIEDPELTFDENQKRIKEYLAEVVKQTEATAKATAAANPPPTGQNAPQKGQPAAA